MDDPAQYRPSLRQMLRQYPALFPQGMAQGLTLHDCSMSVKHDLVVRRITVTTAGTVATLRPAFVLPSMSVNNGVLCDTA